eukprot:TRINITY_DN1598_c6_g1_i3.p1 TRINITY_DN1598_c6_g1~~TRINITY_DN1598_c6_g1_i3.p1  ORF type:complete len:226 (+),score=28.68 TRINITY_DN1598_c6_g1_i3:203-880(+)
MTNLMEKVMGKWVLASGESGLGLITDKGITPLKETTTIAELPQGTSSLVLTGTIVYNICSVVPDLREGSSPGPRRLSIQNGKGLRVKLRKGRVIRLKEVTEDTTVQEVLQSIRLHKEADFEPEGDGDHMLLCRGRPLTSMAAPLSEYGVCVKDIVSYTLLPMSSTPPLSLPKPVKFPPFSATTTASRPLPTLPPLGASPLCQFTLCSLSPIFGPVLPPTLTLPDC